MKIVVCDDNAEDLETVDRLLDRYGKAAADRSLVVEKFQNASVLYNGILQGARADLYILDMIMAEQTGIDIGSLLRTTGFEGMIIYITSSDDFALDAYGVHAARYLLKPVSEESFFEAMDFALSYKKVEKDPLFPVKTKEGTVAVPYSKIEYIENYARSLNVRLTDAELIRSIFIRKSFDEEIREIAADRSFLQVHKSFLINMNYVKRLEQTDIVMESGIHVPISKARAADVKKEYLLFISDCYR